MSTLSLDELKPAIEAIAIDAGKAILEIYSRADFQVETKGDESPLTAADLASHRVIVARLAELTPDIPVLSEESADISWAERQTWDRYWLVDPLDGTKEFIKRNGEFTVNIALINNGAPILGTVYVPVQDVLYTGVSFDDGRASIAEKAVAGVRNPIRVKPHQAGETWVMVGSRSHQSDEVQQYLSDYQPHELMPVGSSLKFCMVAEGRAHQYPRLGLTSEWDTGAAQAVLEAAGGAVINYETQQPLRYNQKDVLLNPYFIATSAS